VRDVTFSRLPRPCRYRKVRGNLIRFKYVRRNIGDGVGIQQVRVSLTIQLTPDSMMATLDIQRKEAPGMDFLCRVCGKRKGEPQGWRFVIELNKPGAEIRNTIFIVDRWDEAKAQGPHATCFCSNECEEKYLAVRHKQLVA